MKFVWEHNGSHTLLYSVDYPGAYTRGETLEIAKSKIPAEIASFCSWRGLDCPADISIEIDQEITSELLISDADSDVLFDSERAPLTWEEYEALKAVVLKSARDFHNLYISIPDKDSTALPQRKTFYGNVPGTAREMYEHTKNVNAYYFAEVGIDADNEGTIYDCRERGFALLEQAGDFLSNRLFDGSYGELWTLRKMMRRFIWHDRIHAKAMCRMAAKTFGPFASRNPFRFPM